MFRQALLETYDVREDNHIITHHWSVYLSPLSDLIIGLFVLYVLRYTLYYLTKQDLFTTIAGILAIVLYVKTLIDFFNLYLDAMVVSSDGVTFYQRKSLVHYQTEHFDRDKVEAMNHTQNSRADKFFNKGDLRVLLEHGTTYRFTNVDRPGHQSAIFLEHKHTHDHDDSADYDGGRDEKFDVLVDALSEVVKDYVAEKSSEAPAPEEPPHRWR